MIAFFSKDQKTAYYCDTVKKQKPAKMGEYAKTMNIL